MALLIEAAETLTGEDARVFIHEMEYPIHSKKKEEIKKLAAEIHAEYPF